MKEKIEFYLARLLFENWRHKLVSFFTATVIWFMVNNSITSSRTLANVPIKIINLPRDKTVKGMLSTGYMRHGIPLTLKGKRSVIDRLEPGDLEIVFDVSSKGEEWVGDVSLKNLQSVNPEIDIEHSVERIYHPEFIMKLSRMLTAPIPVRLSQPKGEPPQGYHFLDIWPQTLYHTVSGAQEAVEKLQNKGIEISFDLNQISKDDLDFLSNTHPDNEEIYYYVPDRWKHISIPFEGSEEVEINDPISNNLHLIFLRNEYLPLADKTPIALFFPLGSSNWVNPELVQFAENEFIRKENGIQLLEMTLYAKNVSRQFLDLVRPNLSIHFTVDRQGKKDALQWSIQCMNSRTLEDNYVKQILHREAGILDVDSKQHEMRIRNRFRDYLRHLELFSRDKHALKLDALLKGNKVHVKPQSFENS